MYLTSPRHLPSIAELHQYWVARCDGRAMPRRADINPADIPHLLPAIALVDIESDPFRVRYRLIGTRLVQDMGRDFTGFYLDELRFDKPDELLALYRRAAEEKMPAFRSSTWRRPDGIVWDLETAILPLSEDGARVSQCLAIEDFQDVRDIGYLSMS